MIVGSLFSGAGLLDCGLHQAGIRHAWFVERDEFRRGLLERRWPGVPVHDDVRTAGAATLAPVDAIVGGFPCKGASSAGKRTGFAHPETALWSEFERIVRELRPRYVLVENVRDILSLHRGEVWGTVLGDLAALGYDVAWDCVPASAVGAPHGRDRVFAVARHSDGARLEGLGVRGAVAERPEAARDAEGTRPAGPGLSGSCGRELPRETGGRRSRRPERTARETAADAESKSERVADHEADAESKSERVADHEADAEPGGGQAWPLPVIRGAEAAADAGRRGRPREGRWWPVEPDERAAGADDQRRGVAVEWGDYQPAITRWEAIHGPAPEPLIRRLDDGDAKLRRMRSRMDRSRLSALGDGVHVHVGRILGEALMALHHADREAAAA